MVHIYQVVDESFVPLQNGTLSGELVCLKSEIYPPHRCEMGLKSSIHIHMLRIQKKSNRCLIINSVFCLLRSVSVSAARITHWEERDV